MLRHALDTSRNRTSIKTLNEYSIIILIDQSLHLKDSRTINWRIIVVRIDLVLATYPTVYVQPSTISYEYMLLLRVRICVIMLYH